MCIRVWGDSGLWFCVLGLADLGFLTLEFGILQQICLFQQHPCVDPFGGLDSCGVSNVRYPGLDKGFQGSAECEGFPVWGFSVGQHTNALLYTSYSGTSPEQWQRLKFKV